MVCAALYTRLRSTLLLFSIRLSLLPHSIWLFVVIPSAAAAAAVAALFLIGIVLAQNFPPVLTFKFRMSQTRKCMYSLQNENEDADASVYVCLG